MTKKIDFYFDFISPYSFLAHKKIINSNDREKFNYNYLETQLSTDGNIEKLIFSAYKRLISIRINEKAFNPFGKFEFLERFTPKK